MSTAWQFRMWCGEKKACLVIAHYNYTLPLTRSGRCPETSLMSFTPENPEQRVTLSLQTPLSGISPQDP